MSFHCFAETGYRQDVGRVQTGLVPIPGHTNQAALQTPGWEAAERQHLSDKEPLVSRATRDRWKGVFNEGYCLGRQRRHWKGQNPDKQT